MPEPEYTQGPWKARGFGIHAPSKWTIAFIETDSHITLDGDFDEPLALANARLIAAAPDLLEALEWAHVQLCPHPQWCESNHPVLKPRHDTIRAALVARLHR